MMACATFAGTHGCCDERGEDGMWTAGADAGITPGAHAQVPALRAAEAWELTPVLQ